METLVRRHHGSSLSGATFAGELFFGLEQSKNLMLRQTTGSGGMVASQNLTSFELIFAAEKGAQVKTTGEKFQAFTLSC